MKKASGFCDNIKNQKSEEENLPGSHLQKVELTEWLTAAVLCLSLGTKQWDSISKTIIINVLIFIAVSSLIIVVFCAFGRYHQ